jgi:pimeloyl-ACP methyl ester carboxylesterase
MISLRKAVGSGLNTMAVVVPKSTGRLTLNLFCRPLKGRKYSAKETAFLEQADWTTLDFEGQPIQCYSWGNGPKKVLLVHGFNSNAARWRLLAGLLQNEDYQVIALDAPAHGKSGWTRANGILYAQLLSVVMKHYRPQYLIGHSFAGFAFTYYYAKMDSLPVDKMVMMGVPNELMAITNIFFDELSLKEHTKTAYLTAFQEKFGHEVDYFTISKLVNRLPFTGLVIHDEEDDICPYEGAKEIHKNWEGAQFFSTKGLGHSLQGRSVYKTILNFLK